MVDTNNYIPMCQALLDHVQFTKASAVPSPEGSPFDATKLAAVITKSQSLLPAVYRTAYVTPLVNALPDVVAQLRQQYEDDKPRIGEKNAMAEVKSMADTLVGAVRDWSEPPYRKPLMRFEAVISNLYRSFLSKEQRASLSLPMIETMPPLATFAHSPDSGPFTLPVDTVKQFIGASVGVVSLPGCFADHPLLWPGLSHECGGHDVIHADPGLIQELSNGVATLGGLPHGVGSMWAFWMDETAADIYGILNIGPTFPLSMAAFFSALEHSADAKQPLGTIGTILPMSQNRLADEHPVDILRLYVASGVISTLEGLAVAKRQEWITAVEDVARQASGGAEVISVFDVDTKKELQKLPIAAMADAARKVGAYVATAKLAALGGHSIQDIETWDDTDEQTAASIASAAATGNIVALGDDAQLLAGATMALMADPTKYAAITTNLNAALDDSFARDPIFGTATPHSAFGLKRHRRDTSRTPGPPSFPLSWTVI